MVRAKVCCLSRAVILFWCTKLVAVTAQSPLPTMPSMPSTECPNIIAEAGLSADYDINIPHHLHCLTVVDIRRYFDENVTEDNGIPTINCDLLSTEPITSHAPLGFESNFSYPGLQILDKVLSSMDNHYMDGKNQRVQERIVHAFHMNSMWAKVQPILDGVRKNPPTNMEVCPCLKDIHNNGIYAMLRQIALENREPELMVTQEEPRTKRAALAPVSGYEKHAALAAVSGYEKHAALAAVSGYEKHAALAPVSGYEKHAALAAVSGYEKHAALAAVSGYKKPARLAAVSGYKKTAKLADVSGYERHAALAAVSGYERHAALAPVSGYEKHAALAPVSGYEKHAALAAVSGYKNPAKLAAVSGYKKRPVLLARVSGYEKEDSILDRLRGWWEKRRRRRSANDEEDNTDEVDNDDDWELITSEEIWAKWRHHFLTDGRPGMGMDFAIYLHCMLDHKEEK